MPAASRINDTVSVFEFTDHRVFLRACYEEKKRATPGWSYARWARSLGMKSVSGLHMAVSGQRRMGSRMIRALISHLDLNSEEAEFFSDLIRLERCGNDPKLSVLLMESLSRRAQRLGHVTLEPFQFAAISGWYFFAIREVVRMADFREDPHWISGFFEFRVSPAEIQSGLKILIKLGLLFRDHEGRLRAADEHLSTRADIADEAQKRFHEASLDHAKESLRRFPPDQREITGTTFTLTTGGMSRAKAMIRKFQSELSSLLEASGEAEGVYQLEIALYPVWRKK
jgi:uncharacterized protein (TIGR02147 family)